MIDLTETTDRVKLESIERLSVSLISMISATKEIQVSDQFEVFFFFQIRFPSKF